MTVRVHPDGLCRCVPAPAPDEAVFRVRPRLGLSIADLVLGAVLAVPAFAAAGAAIIAVPVTVWGGSPWQPGVLSAAGAALAGRAVLWHRFVPASAGQ